MEKKQANFGLPAVELMDQEPVKESFIDTLVRMHQFTEEDAEAMYEREARYYKRIVSESEKISKCTGLSLVSTFFEVAINCLSLQPGHKAESFIESRGSKIIKEVVEMKDGREIKVKKEVWVSIARFVITAYGELNLRIKAGQIIRATNPQVVYEGDTFQPHTNDRGLLTIDYAPAIPRKSKKIIACWVALILPNNGIDFKWILEDDIERLKKHSIPRRSQQNPTPSANALYESNDGQIDPGFLEAKTLKHAFRAYTKLKVSDNVSFDGDEDKDDNSFAAPAQEPTPTVVIEQNENDEEIF